MPQEQLTSPSSGESFPPHTLRRMHLSAERQPWQWIHEQVFVRSWCLNFVKPIEHHNKVHHPSWMHPSIELHAKDFTQLSERTVPQTAALHVWKNQQKSKQNVRSPTLARKPRAPTSASHNGFKLQFMAIFKQHFTIILPFVGRMVNALIENDTYTDSAQGPVILYGWLLLQNAHSCWRRSRWLCDKLEFSRTWANRSGPIVYPGNYLIFPCSRANFALITIVVQLSGLVMGWSLHI